MLLALWYVVLVCHQYDVFVFHQYDVFKYSVGSVFVGSYVGLSESRLCLR